MIEEIRTVAVMVSDGKKAKEWYRDKLGFEMQSDEEHWIVVAPRGSSFGFARMSRRAARTREHWNPVACRRHRNTCKELERKGVQFTRELGRSEWDENLTYAQGSGWQRVLANAEAATVTTRVVDLQST